MKDVIFNQGLFTCEHCNATKQIEWPIDLFSEDGAAYLSRVTYNFKCEHLDCQINSLPNDHVGFSVRSTEDPTFKLAAFHCTICGEKTGLGWPLDFSRSSDRNYFSTNKLSFIREHIACATKK